MKNAHNCTLTPLLIKKEVSMVDHADHADRADRADRADCKFLSTFFS